MDDNYWLAHISDPDQNLEEVVKLLDQSKERKNYELRFQEDQQYKIYAVVKNSQMISPDIECQGIEDWVFLDKSEYICFQKESMVYECEYRRKNFDNESIGDKSSNISKQEQKQVVIDSSQSEQIIQEQQNNQNQNLHKQQQNNDMEIEEKEQEIQSEKINFTNGQNMNHFNGIIYQQQVTTNNKSIFEQIICDGAEAQIRQTNGHQYQKNTTQQQEFQRINREQTKNQYQNGLQEEQKAQQQEVLIEKRSYQLNGHQKKAKIVVSQSIDIEYFCNIIQQNIEQRQKLKRNPKIIKIEKQTNQIEHEADPRRNKDIKNAIKNIQAYISTSQCQKLKLVLDLDETLLNSYTYDPSMGPIKDGIEVDDEFMRTIKFSDGNSVNILPCQIAIRPGLIEFLQELKPFFDFYLYSHGQSFYVVSTLDQLLDPGKKYFCRKNLFLNSGNITHLTQKDVYTLFTDGTQPDLKELVIIDDIYDVWNRQQQENM